MRPMFTAAGIILAVAGLPGGWQARAQEGELEAAAIIERSQRAYHYAGADMQSRVTMELTDPDGGTRTRVMTMLRWDVAEGGGQKYFVYFHEPGDVRRMTFMVWKNAGRDDDRWIFIPAVDLVRRIAADDKRSSFVGSDFTYEDVSGREVRADTHSLLREDELGGRACYVIESLPLDSVEYTRRVSWIDKVNLLPLREEYYDAQGDLYRVFTADRIEPIAAGEGMDSAPLPTVTQRTMANLKTGHRTVVTVNSIAYDVGLGDGDFTERNMRRPPRRWIR